MVVLLKFFWRDCNALVERRNSSDSARSIVADGHFRALACVPAVREAWRMLMICTYCNPNNRVETLGVDSYEVTGTVTVCHSSPSSIRKMQNAGFFSAFTVKKTIVYIGWKFQLGILLLVALSTGSQSNFRKQSIAICCLSSIEDGCT